VTLLRSGGQDASDCAHGLMNNSTLIEGKIHRFNGLIWSGLVRCW